MGRGVDHRDKKWEEWSRKKERGEDREGGETHHVIRSAAMRILQ